MPEVSSIQKGKVVDLSYTLKDSDGELLDQADTQDPFSYLHGADEVVPGLEKALEGLNIGDKKVVVVSAAEGYGEVDEQLKVAVKRSQFPKGADLKAGMQFETESPDGEPMIFEIEKVEGEQVFVNGNHPLAGVTLHFDVEVLGVRDATEEEVEHGHAHGPHGHDHDHSHDHDEEDCCH